MKLHKQLNPKLWNGYILKEEVENKIIKIVEAFKEFINFSLDIHDIILVGSNCSYNYTERSDLDVHITVDFSKLPINKAIASDILNLYKAKFNSTYDIFIKGIEVEMYIQDINSDIASNGIYSVLEKAWIHFPDIDLLSKVPIYKIDKEVTEWTNKINDVLTSNSRIAVEDCINKLYELRHSAINTDGEYSKGNQIFKAIRDKGLLKELKDTQIKLISSELSLESLNIK